MLNVIDLIRQAKLQGREIDLWPPLLAYHGFRQLVGTHEYREPPKTHALVMGSGASKL